jgi:hypothetical protein
MKRTRTNHVTAGACPHCGREMITNALSRHIRRLLPTLDNAPAGGTILARCGRTFVSWGVR